MQWALHCDVTCTCTLLQYIYIAENFVGFSLKGTRCLGSDELVYKKCQKPFFFK